MNIFKILPAAGLGRSLGKRNDGHRNGAGNAGPVGCRKSGLRHFFEVFIAPLRLRRGQGAMQGKPQAARGGVADLPHTSRGPLLDPSGRFALRRQIRLKPKRAAIFHSPEVFRQAAVPALPAPFSIIPTGIWSAIPRARPPAGRIPLRRSGGIWPPPPAAHKTTG